MRHDIQAKLPVGDSKISPGQDGNLQIENKKMTMARFAEFIGRYSELPLVDLTGLKGVLRNGVRCLGRGSAQRCASSRRRKLGLKLESREAPAEVLVIDKVENIPTAN